MTTRDEKYKFKFYGSLLKDDPEVLAKANIYPHIIKEYNVADIPETFDGRFVWALYIQASSNQLAESSWALVAKDILNDRFSIASGGQIIFNLDYFEILACIGHAPIQKKPGVLSSATLDYSNACQGYSIYDAWEHMYKYGLSQANCFSYKKLKDRNIETPDSIPYSKKIEQYGLRCNKIEGADKTGCLTTYNGTPIARRIFFPSAIFNVTGNTMNELIMNIKYQIVKWGPVAGGMIIYENFVDGYDGKTVYDHVVGKPLGGHYVSIIGWDKESWICRNSWGSDWGLLGYFKIKFGLKECMLEQNISAVVPYIYDFKPGKEINIKDGMLQNRKIVDINDMEQINPDIYAVRNSLKIDYSLFYPQKTVELIKKGKLYGSLQPLIPDGVELPNQTLFWAKDIANYNFLNLTDVKYDQEVLEKPMNNLIWFILSCMVAIYIGYKIKDKK